MTNQIFPTLSFRVFLMSALVLCVCVVAGCDRSGSQQADASVGAASENEQDGADIESEEERFVVLSPALGVMLRDLGFEDSIVGRHSYDNALSRSIPAVGSHLDIDYELLVTLEPTDLFFEINSVQIPQRVKDLASQHNWQIWTYELKTLDDIAITVDDLYLKLVGFNKDPGESPQSPMDVLGIDLQRNSPMDVELPSARLAQAWSPMGQLAAELGRTLVLAGVDPPGAMGPGSFHGQLIERLGITPALDTGGMWQELDYEDIIHLAPDSILVFSPKEPSANDGIGEPEQPNFSQIQTQLGGIAQLPIPAVEHQRIAIIDHPLGLLPSSSFGQVADEVRRVVEAWKNRSREP